MCFSTTELVTCNVVQCALPKEGEPCASHVLSAILQAVCAPRRSVLAARRGTCCMDARALRRYCDGTCPRGPRMRLPYLGT